MSERCGRALEIDVAELFAEPDSETSREFRDHAERCEVCDAEVRAWRELRRALAEDADHVDDALLLAYADARSALTEVERAVVSAHLIGCASCRDELSVLESIRIQPAAAGRSAGEAPTRASRLLAAVRGLIWHPGFAYALVLLALVPTLARMGPRGPEMIVASRATDPVARTAFLDAEPEPESARMQQALDRKPPALRVHRSREARATGRDEAAARAELGAARNQVRRKVMAAEEAAQGRAAAGAAPPAAAMAPAAKPMADAAPTSDGFEAAAGRHGGGALVAFAPGGRRRVTVGDGASALVIGFGVRGRGSASTAVEEPMPTYDSEDAEAIARMVDGVEVPAGTRGVELRVVEAGGGRELRYRRDDLTIEAGAAVYLAMRVSSDWAESGTYVVTLHAGGNESPIAKPFTLAVDGRAAPAR